MIFVTGINFDWNKYQYLEKFVPEGMPMTLLALRYLLDLDTTQTILLGGKSLANYQEAIASLALNPLGEELHSKIDRARSWRNVLRQTKTAVKTVGKKLTFT